MISPGCYIKKCTLKGLWALLKKWPDGEISYHAVGVNYSFVRKAALNPHIDFIYTPLLCKGGSIWYNTFGDWNPK